MGQGTQASQETPEGHQLSVHQDHQGARAPQARRRARKRKEVEPLPALGEELGKTVYHFFPQFRRWLTALPDARQQGKVVYNKIFCVWSALSIFMQALGSRRQFLGERQHCVLVFGLLAGMEACVLQEENVSVLHRRNGGLFAMADAIVHEVDGLAG